MVKQPSTYRGVYKSGNKFRAQIQTNGVQQYLGVFNTEFEAARVYDEYAKMALGANAKTNFQYSDLASLPVPNKKLGTGRVYAGIPKRTASGATMDELTALLARVETEELDSNEGSFRGFPYEPTAVSVNSSILNSMNEETLQYFAGVLSYDQVSSSYQWMGTWLNSSNGKPAMSEFVKSVNYFEFHSSKVPSECALSKRSLYRNKDGVLCGLLKPCDTHFSGFIVVAGSKQDENGLKISVQAIGNSFGLVTKYTVKSNCICISSYGQQYTMTGEFHCDTGVLEMTRYYLK